MWRRAVAAALLGDAAHLSTPMLGQGTSAAFEDALALGRDGEHCVRAQPGRVSRSVGGGWVLGGRARPLRCETKKKREGMGVCVLKF